VKLTYETGIATLVQFIVLSLLNIATQTTAVVTSCRHTTNCVTTSLSSTAYFMLIVIWFGLVWQLGYRAQKKRSRNLCLLLIAAEGLIAIIALSNAKHHNDIIGLITSLTDIGLAVWVALLAVRLLRARGGRIVASERSRQRHRPDTKL
jgi:hypothetical protein